MFTGIVEEIGEIRARQDLADAARLAISGPLVCSDAQPGHSISVNGVCLTVVTVDAGVFTTDVMAETLRRSSLADLRPGSRVNLERAVRVSDRLGGHVVQGHVDATARVVSLHPAQHWTVVRLALPASLARYVVEKGSVTVDGVSLTVSALGPDHLEVSLIPTTLAATTLGALVPGGVVNIEVDVLAKYVESLLAAGTPTAAAGGRS